MTGLSNGCAMAQRFAVEATGPVLRKLIDRPEIAEATLISTCNRVELVVNARLDRGQTGVALGVLGDRLERVVALHEEIAASEGITLTPAGAMVVPEATILIDRFDNLHAEVTAHAQLEGGTVRIGGGATAVSYVLPGAIAAYQSDHPAVRSSAEAGQVP